MDPLTENAGWAEARREGRTNGHRQRVVEDPQVCPRGNRAQIQLAGPEAAAHRLSFLLDCE